MWGGAVQPLRDFSHKTLLANQEPLTLLRTANLQDRGRNCRGEVFLSRNMEMGFGFWYEELTLP